MIKPDWCPQDVWDVAYTAIGFESGCDCDHCCQTQGLLEPVASAILAAKRAEAEVCAQVADDIAAKNQGYTDGPGALRVAAAIRNRSSNP